MRKRSRNCARETEIFFPSLSCFISNIGRGDAFFLLNVFYYFMGNMHISLFVKILSLLLPQKQ